MHLRPTLLVALLALAACTRTDAPLAVEETGTPAAPVPPGPTDLSVATDSLVDRTTPGIAVAVAFPRVEGVAGAVAPTALAAANRVIRDSVQAFVDAIRPPEPPGEFDVTDRFATEGGFETTLFEHDLYSGIMSASTFAGGAHPNHFYQGLTVDLRTGAPVALASLFRPGAPYLDTLAAHAERGVARQLAERGGMTPDEARAAVADFNPGGVRLPSAIWTLTPDGLRVYLPPYAVMAYAAGSFEVDVPADALRPLLALEGVAVRVFGSR